MMEKYEKIRLIINLFITTDCDIEMVKNSYSRNNFLPLQDFISSNLKPSVNWVTGISVIDIAETMYYEALSNGNLGSAEDLWV